MKEEPLLPPVAVWAIAIALFIAGAAGILLADGNKAEMAKVVQGTLTVGAALIGIFLTINANVVLDARRRAGERAEKKRRSAATLYGAFEGLIAIATERKLLEVIPQWAQQTAAGEPFHFSDGGAGTAFLDEMIKNVGDLEAADVPAILELYFALLNHRAGLHLASDLSAQGKIPLAANVLKEVAEKFPGRMAAGAKLSVRLKEIADGKK